MNLIYVFILIKNKWKSIFKSFVKSEENEISKQKLIKSKPEYIKWNNLIIFDLTKGVGPGCTDKTLLSAIASALHTSGAPITGQLSAAVEKNPGVWLNTAQPLCKAFIVTDEDIRYSEWCTVSLYVWGNSCKYNDTVEFYAHRKQEELVYSVRKRLEEALMADMLAHVEETTSEGDALKQEENCNDDKQEV